MPLEEEPFLEVRSLALWKLSWNVFLFKAAMREVFFGNNFFDIFWLINNQVKTTSHVIRGGTISWDEKFGLVKIKVIEWYTFSEICEHCEFHEFLYTDRWPYTDGSAGHGDERRVGHVVGQR